VPELLCAWTDESATLATGKIHHGFFGTHTLKLIKLTIICANPPKLFLAIHRNKHAICYEPNCASNV
jgi:hypothetical protein